MTTGQGLERIPLPKGYWASGVNSGVRRYRPDIGLITSDRNATAVGVFTRNTCQASPVKYSKKLVPSDSVRAVFTNSGQANAATGPAGDEANLKMIDAVARASGCRPDQVLIASTGVIGVVPDLGKILPAIEDLYRMRTETVHHFALSILTTDLVPKAVSKMIELSKGTVRVTGVSKGSGMIHPNMGTMLGYVLTDLELDPKTAETFLREATDQSFNMISVDGDTSTNDTVFFLANGAAGVRLEDDSDREKFFNGLLDVCQALAQSIARDGEGAQKLVEVWLRGAPDLEIARKAARGVIVSPLVKTAIHGEDPNWGRILARLGAEGVPEEALARSSLSLQGMRIFEEGAPIPFQKDDVRKLLRQDTIRIEIHLRSGGFEAKAWGCDLSKRYVEINTEYTT